MTQVPCNRLCAAQSLQEQLHISDLPDGVIGHILSRLPIKDAIKKSVLSRDWEHKWTLMTDIEIDDYDYIYNKPLPPDDITPLFINFVYKVLTCTCNSTLSRFSLGCSRQYHPSYLEMWISMALRRNVERLKIFTSIVPKIDSGCFSGWTSLTELDIRLSCTLVIPTDNYCFSKLKKLRLESNDYDYENIKLKTVQPTADRLKLTFPILEDLVFTECEWLDVSIVEIHAPELMSFQTTCVEVERNYEIKIFATKLAKIQVMGCFLDSFDLHTPAISHATLFNPYHSPWQEHYKTSLPQAHKVLKKLTDVKYLALSGDIVKYYNDLGPSSRLGLGFPTFGRLKELHLKCHCDIEDVIYVLQVLPPLDSLTLDVMLWEDTYERLGSWPPKIVSTLKKIKLLYFKETNLHYAFSKFVLENARNLEEMAVSTWLRPEEKEETVRCKLSSLKPKTSSCQIVLVGHEQCKRQ